MKSRRLKALDSARGIALFLTILSHFGAVYFQSRATRRWSVMLIEIGMAATPTFLVVSGLLLGFLFHTSGPAFGQLRARLIDRGLFLLLVGHVLIGLAFLPSQHTLPISLSTDAIGAALIIGPLLIAHLDGRTRVALSISLYVLGWTIVLFWRPAGYAAFIEEVLSGNTAHASSFPIMPWVSVYLASSVYGQRFGALYIAGRVRRAAHELAAIAATLWTAAAAAKLLIIGAQINPATQALAERLHDVFGLGEKYPPGPVYLLFFGGIAFAIVAACVVFELEGWARRVMHVAAMWGEASLALYVVQFYVLWLGVRYLSAGSLAEAPFFFMAVVALMTVLAQRWLRFGANRFITVGYVAFCMRRKPAHA